MPSRKKSKESRGRKKSKESRGRKKSPKRSKSKASRKSPKRPTKLNSYSIESLTERLYDILESRGWPQDAIDDYMDKAHHRWTRKNPKLSAMEIKYLNS